MTGSSWLTLYPGKILALADLKDRLATSIRESQRQHQEDLWGYGGTLGSVKAVFTYASSKLTLSADGEGWTGSGYRLTLDAGAAAWTSIPFANSGATVYYVAARWNDYPANVESGCDGLLAYGYTVEAVGELGNPTAVTVVTTTLELTLGTALVGPGWTTTGSRPVKVWLAAGPQSATYATAVYSGTASYSGGVVKVVVPHYLGQITPSTTASAYNVLVEGPTIGTTDTRANTDYLFLGTVTSTVWSGTDQKSLTAVGTWISAFLVEHKDTGEHTAVHAQTVGATGAGAKYTAQAVDPADMAQAVFLGKDNTSLQKVALYVNEGGILDFTNAHLGSGAWIKVGNPAPGTTRLTITNPRSATDYATLTLDGIVEWKTDKSANTWATQCNLGTTPTHYIRNIGAGGASLDVETNITAGGAASFGDALVRGTGEFHFQTAHDMREGLPAWCAKVISGTAEVDTTTTPPKIRSGSDTLPVTLAIPLSGAWWKDGDAEGLVLDSFSVLHRRAAAADAITATIYRVAAGGGSARVAVSTLTASDTSGAWTVSGMSATGIAHTVLAGTLYWIEITIDPNAARGDVEVSLVNMNALQTNVR